jgi:hypothetical protein
MIVILRIGTYLLPGYNLYYFIRLYFYDYYPHEALLELLIANTLFTLCFVLTPCA